MAAYAQFSLWKVFYQTSVFSARRRLLFQDGENSPAAVEAPTGVQRQSKRNPCNLNK